MSRIHNPTMDAEKFARQFSRIRERDAERASCSRNAHAQDETEALRLTQEDPDAARLRRFRALLGSVTG